MCGSLNSLLHYLKYQSRGRAVLSELIAYDVKPCSSHFTVSFNHKLVSPARRYRSNIVTVCYLLLVYTTRSISARIRLIRVDSLPRLWEVEIVAGTSRYSPRYSASGRLTSLFELVSLVLLYFIKYIIASQASNR